MSPQSLKHCSRAPGEIALLAAAFLFCLFAAAQEGKAQSCSTTVIISDGSDSGDLTGTDDVDAALSATFTGATSINSSNLPPLTCSKWSLPGTALMNAVNQCGRCGCNIILRTDGIPNHRNPFIVEQEIRLFQQAMPFISSRSGSYLFGLSSPTQSAAPLGAWGALGQSNIDALEEATFQHDAFDSDITNVGNLSPSEIDLTVGNILDITSGNK